MTKRTQSRVCFVVGLFLVLCLGSSAWAEKPSSKDQTQGKNKSKTTWYLYTAETEDLVKKQGKVRAGGLSWTCKGKRCAITGPWPTPGVSACKALAKEVGQIKSYGHAKKKLNAAQLNQCNADVPSVASKLPPKSKPGFAPKGGWVAGKDKGKKGPGPSTHSLGPENLQKKHITSLKSVRKPNSVKGGEDAESAKQSMSQKHRGLGKGGFVPTQKGSSGMKDRTPFSGKGPRGFVPLESALVLKTINPKGELTMTGIGTSRKTIAPGGELIMTGMGFSPDIITPNGELTMTGIREGVKVISPAGTLMMTGAGFSPRTITPAGELKMTGTRP